MLFNIVFCNDRNAFRKLHMEKMATLSQFCGRLSNQEYGKYWHYENDATVYKFQ